MLQSSSLEKDAELRGELKSVFRKILNNRDKKKPLSLMHTYISIYFDSFILEQCPEQWRDKLISGFKDYKPIWEERKIKQMQAK